MILEELEKMEISPPGLFLNGMPCFNLKYIATLTSNDVDRIEVCKHPIMYGNLTYYGIVSIFNHSLEFQPGIYNNPFCKIDNKVVEDGLSDKNILINRQTLFFTPCIYWNPDVTIAGNKIVCIEFDTPNIETEYLVKINGVYGKRTPYSKTLSFKIED